MLACWTQGLLWYWLATVLARRTYGSQDLRFAGLTARRTHGSLNCGFTVVLAGCRAGWLVVVLAGWPSCWLAVVLAGYGGGQLVQPIRPANPSS